MAGRVELKTGGRVGEGWGLIKAQLDQQCGGEVQGLGRVQSSSLRVGLCASRAILQKIEERKNNKNIDSILKKIEYSPASFCSSIFLSLSPKSSRLSLSFIIKRNPCRLFIYCIFSYHLISK